MRSITIPKYVRNIIKFNNYSNEARIVFIHQHYLYFKKGDPEVSIMIPAYNEAEGILKTLHSLILNKTKRAVEIIVVNNNSTDNTEALVKATGIKCINETVKGITAARNAALGAAKGKFVLSADATVIYPKNWIEEMVAPLEKEQQICVTYGRFSLLPTAGTARFVYFIYEYLADVARFYDGRFKDEALNVFGFNFGFRREQGLIVDWFNHPRDVTEDCWMAMKLRDKGFGRIHVVTNPKALVWCSDRSIQRDGGLAKGIRKRINRVFFDENQTRS